VISDYFTRSGRSFKDTQIPVLKGDGLRQTDPARLERSAGIKVVLDNLRSVFNVGSIFRTSECLALGELVLCGTTPTPEHPNMSKTAMGTCERVSWRHTERTVDAILELKEKGYRIYALETAEAAVSVMTFKPDHPFALVLGNESLGISPTVLSLCDMCLALPVMGWKNSLNVGVAFAIASYQLVFA